MKRMFAVLALALCGCSGYGPPRPYYPMPVQQQQYQQPMQRPAVTMDCTTFGNQTTCREHPHFNILEKGCNPDYPASCVQVPILGH